GDGSELTSLPPHAVTGGDVGRDLEIPRGELTEALYATVRDRVEFVFDDRADTLVETGHGVDVTFRSGTARTFDLVFGADGTHSRTREMLFGPEERFHHHLGHCFAVFTLPNTLALSHETVVWNTPGRAVALYAVGDGDEVHAFLDFARPEPPREVSGDRAAGLALLTEVFADAGWRVPEILTALHAADDVFLDTVGQIRMPRWTSGRAALLGDAAYAPSFLTGQGTSLALVGAYMLAASLAGHRDHTAGLAAYEHGTRPFVTLNQNLVGEGGATLFPATAEALPAPSPPAPAGRGPCGRGARPPRLRPVRARALRRTARSAAGCARMGACPIDSHRPRPRTSSSTRTTPSTGGRGRPARSRRPGGVTSRSS